MTGNNTLGVLLNGIAQLEYDRNKFLDEAVCLRDSGFVQQGTSTRTKSAGKLPPFAHI